MKKKIQEQAANKADESRSKFHGNQYTEVSSPNGDHTKIKTDKELAKIAGVSAGTVARFNKVMNSDDEILLDLLESNIRRRGEVGGSAKKVGKRIKELERIYGVRDGSAGQSDTKLSGGNVFYQSDIAEMIGISVDTLQNYKKLTELVPELDELVQTD